MTWAIFISAFSLGLLSSFHCVGMCGAIAFSLPTQHLGGSRKVAGIILYNIGRITTYTCFGLAFGLVGRSIYLAGFQQWFSIIAGVVILIIALQSVVRRPIVHLPGFTRMQLAVQKLIGRFLKSPSFMAMFLLGAANGLLPCGLVYLAITGALAAGSVEGSAGFMASFGMGTVPAMFLMAYFGYIIKIETRNIIRKAVPYVVAIMAVLLILRGLNLNIPYISPSLSSQSEVVECH